ncbi:MAG: hypothetical protein KDK64_04550 [Chlamydiia bacterium]|nr:hypothetical protein [Chlamydiia bacterium]
MAEARIERPFDLFSTPAEPFSKEGNPLLYRKEQESKYPQQTGLEVSRKRPASEEAQEERGTKHRKIESYTSPTSSVKEGEKELFPEIKRALPLPEEAPTEVNFDQPAFAAPREKPESKPTLPPPVWVETKPAKKKEESNSPSSWLRGWIPWGESKSSSVTIGEHRQTEEAPKMVEPVVDYHRRVGYVPSQRDRDELSHLPNHGGAVLAKLVGMITDYQAMSQTSQLEVFSVTSDRLQELRRKQFETVLEQIRNRKDLENWSFRRDLLEYFAITTGIIGGATLIGASITTGGASAVPGYQMLAGSTIALSAKLAGKYYEDQTYTPLVVAGGTLFSGYGMATGMAALGSVPKMLATATTATTKFSEFAIGLKHNETQANQFKVNAKNVKLQYERENNQQEMQKLVGGLKASKASSDLLGAATKALRTESEIKSQIALGNKY